MGEAVFADRPFRIDPESVAWDYRPKVAVHQTLAGKVVQVLGVVIGDMTVVGSFGRGGWEAQERFLSNMKTVADQQVERDAGQPVRFHYPVRGWDFPVYLKDYSTPDGANSVTMSPNIINPRWQLTLFLPTPGFKLQQAATNQFLQRLKEGLGFKINEFNGPMIPPSQEEVDRRLNWLMQTKTPTAPVAPTP